MKRDLVLFYILFKYVFTREIGIKRRFEHKDSRMMMIKTMMIHVWWWRYICIIGRSRSEYRTNKMMMKMTNRIMNIGQPSINIQQLQIYGMTKSLILSENIGNLVFLRDTRLKVIFSLFLLIIFIFFINLFFSFFLQ